MKERVNTFCDQLSDINSNLFGRKDHTLQGIRKKQSDFKLLDVHNCLYAILRQTYKAVSFKINMMYCHGLHNLLRNIVE